MGKPLFLLQIVTAANRPEDRAVVCLPGGGPLEVDLIDICTKHILSKGVGFFRSESHVEQDIREGLKDAIMSLKDQTKHAV